jgi:hypothetical protein
MNQRQATVNAIMSVLAERGVNYEFNCETSVSEFLTADDKKNIVALICSGFKSGRIDMSEEAKGRYLSDDGELKKYTVGLLNNWIRKAPEFNGGSKYEIKNKGSRTGSSDEQLKALKELMKITTDATLRSEIQSAIDDRLEEIKPKVEINVDALPEHLKHLVK